MITVVNDIKRGKLNVRPFVKRSGNKIVYRWYNEVLSPCLEKTKEQFTEKFYLEELLQQLSDDDKISYAKEIYNHLFKDLRKRATREPLLELPKFILKEIEKDHSLEMSYQGLL